MSRTDNVAVPPIAPLLSDHHIVDGLTAHGEVFLFVYSPAAKSLISWSENAGTVLGVRDVAIARDGNVFLRHVHPDDRFKLFSDLEGALSGRSDYRATYRWIRPDTDQVRWLHCRGGLRFRGTESLFEGFIIDLSAELAGTEGNPLACDSPTEMLMALPMTVFALDRDLRITRCNRPAGAELPTDFGDPHFRLEQFAVGKNFIEGLSPGGDREALSSSLEKILSGELARYELRSSSGAGVSRIEFTAIQDHGSINGILGLVTDVTPLAALETRIAELRAAEGLRTLATGVIDNLNNALQRIVGQAALLAEEPGDPEMVRKICASITEVARRTGDLTRQLFIFGEESLGAPIPVDLNVAVMAATSRIKDIFSTEPRVAVAFGGIGTARGRHDVLVSVIERVVREVRERTPAGSGLTIKTCEHMVGGTPRLRVMVMCSAPSGELPQSTVTALQQVIASFGGSVSIERAPLGRYTLAIDLLPASERACAASAQELRLAGSPPGILIVDDDQMVLDTMQAVLADLGFSALAATDAATALELVKTHQSSLQLVLLDALMPGTDGASLLKRILRRAPHLKVLGFSGAPQHITDTLLQAGALRIIRKPVEPEVLKAAVEAVMAGRAAA
jgi:CheY-like chemotaxis protein